MSNGANEGMSRSLNPEKALIFRITHIDNVPWLLDHGLHCRNGGLTDPSFRSIGNPELIDKRRHPWIHERCFAMDMPSASRACNAIQACSSIIEK